MPQTLLVHFISDVLRDPELRCQVLKNEAEGAKAYGLSDAQVAVMRSLDKQKIVAAMLEELLAIGVDLDAKKNEVLGGGGGGGGGALALANLYSAGGIHPRKVIPSTIAAGVDCRITVCGNGFDKYAAVRFTDGTNQVPGRVVAVRCDADLYQRLEIEVKLPAGTYTIEARNSPDEPWQAGGTGNPLAVQITAA